MNKSELIEELAGRLTGDKKAAAAALDGIVDIVLRRVSKGEKVSITGFGVFEKRARAARTARNPATGATIKLKKTNVPAFRAGTTFKNVVSGSTKLPALKAVKAAASAAKPATARVASSRTAAAAKPAATRATSTRTTAARTTRAAAAKPPTTRATATKAAAKPAAKATKATAAKPAAARKTTTRKTAGKK